MAAEENQRRASSSRSCRVVAAKDASSRSSDTMVAAEGAASRAAVGGSPNMAVVTVEGVVEDWGCSDMVAVGSQRRGSSCQVETVPHSWELCRGPQRL